MDAHTFDRWTTAVAQHSTRRTALRFLAGSLLGGLLARRASMSARAAQIDDVGFTDTVPLLPCEAQGLTNCGGYCADTASDPANCGACGNVCPMGDACIGGWCQTLAASDTGLTNIGGCADGLTDCEGYCADLTSDPNNCGFCGQACYPEDTCQRGSCNHDLTICLASGPNNALCPPSWLCIDLNTNPNHCGACGNSCPLGGFCQGAVCTG